MTDDLKVETNTKIPEENAILTITPAGEVSVKIPSAEGTQDVPWHVLFACALALRISKEPSFIEEQMEWFATNIVKGESGEGETDDGN